MALDIDTMRLFEDEVYAWLRLEEWVNKTLNFRGTEIVFNEDPEAEADVDLGWAASVTGVPRFMALFFPWLDYDACAVDDDLGSGEITMHTLEVRLSDVGRAFLMLEDYYRDGLPERPDPEAEIFADAEYEDYLNGLEDENDASLAPESGASSP